MKASVCKLCTLAFLCLMLGCATQDVRKIVQHTQLPRQIELTDTPFFPQETFQCGPAALATALNAVNIPVTPEQLTPELYIPSRQGSLQIEMLAAARRHHAVATRTPPRLESLLQEIAAGNVVVVMQNLGLSWAPSWHYAVVIGYDLDRELIWLRSGTYQRFEMRLSAFQRTWARSEYWAFTALPPGALPATASPEEVASALVAYEKLVPAYKQKIAYQSAVVQWPSHLVFLMGLGNSAYLDGDLPTATKAFQQAIASHPTSAAAHNNLAHVLLAQQDLVQARLMAEKGLDLANNDSKLKAQIMQTLAEILASQSQH